MMTDECIECGARGREPHEPYCAHRVDQRGLGARYVAVRHSASFFESQAKSWRRWALLGWTWGTVATTLALLVVIR